jgi:hypothetical protein
MKPSILTQLEVCAFFSYTTSTTGAMDALAEPIKASVQYWSAVICTSTAVKDMLCISKLVLTMLPVIPLGIYTQDFEFTKVQKANVRKELTMYQVLEKATYR